MHGLLHDECCVVVAAHISHLRCAQLLLVYCSAPTAMCFCDVSGTQRLITACEGETFLWSLESGGAERCVRLDTPEVESEGRGVVRHVSAWDGWSCTVCAHRHQCIYIYHSTCKHSHQEDYDAVQHDQRFDTNVNTIIHSHTLAAATRRR